MRFMCEVACRHFLCLFIIRFGLKNTLNIASTIQYTRYADTIRKRKIEDDIA